jgi:nucleoside phosphorylase
VANLAPLAPPRRYRLSSRKEGLGRLGSGDLVIDSPKKVEELQGLWRQMLGVEMEVYAVYQACRQAIHPPPEYFCVKSVCDLGKDKTSEYQPYAAFVAANYVFHLIRGPLENIFS